MAPALVCKHFYVTTPPVVTPVERLNQSRRVKRQIVKYRLMSPPEQQVAPAFHPAKLHQYQEVRFRETQKLGD